MSGQFIDGGLFRLLGPVRLDLSGRIVELGPGKQRCLVAALLLAPAQPVPVDELVDRIWGARPPERVRNVLATYAARLRRILEPVGAPALRYTSGGYLLDCRADRTDLHQARALVAQSRTAGQPGEVEWLLRRAAAYWRAAPVAGLAGDWADRLRESLRRERIDVVTRWADAALATGHRREVIEELRRLVAVEPTAEEPAGRLIGALAAAGRNAEAVQQYLAFRTELEVTLGVSPSVELQTLYLTLLRTTAEAGVRLATTAPAAAAVTVLGARPAQLPPDIAGFTGRDEALAQLQALITGSPPGVVAAVTGLPGVGKTTLAVHWAHRVRPQFPDGQLYINLRGYEPNGGVPATASEALRGFLDALAVPPQRIPIAVAEQAALFRSLLADRRLLVLLDNARDAEHIRPLLPGTAGSFAIVTSRSQLTSLAATHGAAPVPLDPFSEAEARNLLAQRVGARRLAAEPEAAAALIRACARLPLALAVVATRLRHHDFTLAAVVADLTDATQRWQTLDAGDPATRVYAVLSASYVAQPSDAARLFRLLGLHPGPDISLAAAAALAGRPRTETQRLLTTLCRASMLTEGAAGRYTCHDLLRALAADLSERHDDEAGRQAARNRLLDHYLHSAYAADRLISPARADIVIALAPASPGSHPESFADAQAAANWLTTEKAVLLAILFDAARAGTDARAWQLAWALDTHLRRRGDWAAGQAAWRAVLPVAKRLRDPAAEGLAHRLLAVALTPLLQYADAQHHLAEALRVYSAAGDDDGIGHTENMISRLWSLQQLPERALLHAERAVAAHRRGRDRVGKAYALNWVGWISGQLGDHPRGLDCCEQALELFRQLGDQPGKAATLDSLGFIHFQAGDPNQAVPHYREALEIFRTVGDRYNEADVLNHLAQAQRAMGEAPAAKRTWTRALDILVELDHPDAEDIRTALADLDEPQRSTRVRW
jgi:DNA-binding SARP family transcriptional activator/tetratricopeptide (TPR) repeat protein